MTYYITKKNDTLSHYGVIGMKWGVRKLRKPYTPIPKGKLTDKRDINRQLKYAKKQARSGMRYVGRRPTRSVRNKIRNREIKEFNNYLETKIDMSDPKVRTKVEKTQRYIEKHYGKSWRRA